MCEQDVAPCASSSGVAQSGQYTTLPPRNQLARLRAFQSTERCVVGIMGSRRTPQGVASNEPKARGQRSWLVMSLSEFQPTAGAPRLMPRRRLELIFSVLCTGRIRIRLPFQSVADVTAISFLASVGKLNPSSLYRCFVTLKTFPSLPFPSLPFPGCRCSFGRRFHRLRLKYGGFTRRRE